MSFSESSKSKRQLEPSAAVIDLTASFDDDENVNVDDIQKIQTKTSNKENAKRYKKRAAELLFENSMDLDSSVEVLGELTELQASSRRHDKNEKNKNLVILDDDEDPNFWMNQKMPAKKSKTDHQMAVELQAQLEAEEALQAKARQEQESMMTKSPLGKAWTLVAKVIQVCQAYDAKLVQPIATDDLVYMAIQIIVEQQSFLEDNSNNKKHNVCPSVDLGYHYTNSVNLESIRENGLLSKPERASKDVKADRFKGALFGHGIYTGHNPTDFEKYGDTGLLVARLVGTGQTQMHQLGPLLVLKKCSQCLPLVQYPNTKESKDIMTKVQKDLGVVIDEFFNRQLDDKLWKYRCVVDGKLSDPISGLKAPPKSNKIELKLKPSTTNTKKSEPVIHAQIQAHRDAVTAAVANLPALPKINLSGLDFYVSHLYETNQLQPLLPSKTKNNDATSFRATALASLSYSYGELSASDKEQWLKLERMDKERRNTEMRAYNDALRAVAASVIFSSTTTNAGLPAATATAGATQASASAPAQSVARRTRSQTKGASTGDRSPPPTASVAQGASIVAQSSGNPQRAIQILDKYFDKMIA